MWKMCVSQEQGPSFLNRHSIEGETSCRNKVLISAKHMADVQDSQVKCYTCCLDSPTATQSSVSTSYCNKNICNTVSQYRAEISVLGQNLHIQNFHSICQQQKLKHHWKRETHDKCWKPSQNKSTHYLERSSSGRCFDCFCNSYFTRTQNKQLNF